MISEPYLFFAEVSLDLSRGKFQSGIDKLDPVSDQFSDSYLFHFLYAKALNGLRRNTLASKYFQICCSLAPANQVARQEIVGLENAVNSEEQVELSVVFDPVTDELEKLTAALMKFEPVKTSENADPTSILEQKQPLLYLLKALQTFSLHKALIKRQ
jgi:hypothetical protein